MDFVSAYSFATAGWQLIQAAPLVIWPQAINGLLNIDSDIMHPSTAVENYFARSLGFAQVTLALVVVVLTGAFPLASSTDRLANDVPPYASAVVLFTTLHHTATAFYTWAKFSSTSQTGFLLGFIGSACLAVFGLWCLMFGSEKSRVSSRTGADKRTSGFPFTNQEAAKRKGH